MHGCIDGSTGDFKWEAWRVTGPPFQVRLHEFHAVSVRFSIHSLLSEEDECTSKVSWDDQESSVYMCIIILYIYCEPPNIFGSFCDSAVCAPHTNVRNFTFVSAD